jgi:hypothetical protein
MYRVFYTVGDYECVIVFIHHTPFINFITSLQGDFHVQF